MNEQSSQSQKSSIPVLAKLHVSESTRLLNQLRKQIRYLHYSLRTKEAYVVRVTDIISAYSRRIRSRR